MKYSKFLLIAFACTASAWAAPDWTRGSIVKVDVERSQVVLKHQRIKSIGMEAMTMPFKVAQGVKLTSFKEGDKVRFTVATQNDHLVINALEVVK